MLLHPLVPLVQVLVQEKEIMRELSKLSIEIFK